MKTDNQEFLQSTAATVAQLALPLALAPSKTAPKSRSEEADALGITLTELLAREQEKIYARWEARGVSRREYWDLACSIIDHPEIYRSIPSNQRFFEAWESAGVEGLRALRDGTQPKPKAPKPYRPWSEERKQRDHLRRMLERVGKLYTIPELLHPAIQDELLKNPAYYGVCVLPSEPSCPINPPSPEHVAALEKEKALREAERLAWIAQQQER